MSARPSRWTIIGLAVVLFGLTNLPWHLDDYDQAKQAFTSFEMVESGHWFYQHTPNWWVATKPPLVGWISAGLYQVGRSWELAWRLPSFLAAVALLALVMRAAAVYGPGPSLIAGCAFSFNLFTPRLASLVRTDLPLALAIGAIGILIWQKIRERTAWTFRDQVILFGLLSAAMLIKGPIVLAFLLPGILAVSWRSRRIGQANPAWNSWLPWLLSFLVFLLWVAGGILFVPEFTEHVVLREFAGRFSEEVHRPQPFYFYLPHLLHRFAPWSLWLIALPFFWRAERRRKQDRPAADRWWERMSPETFWLLAWSLGGLLVMSCIPSKRIDRIFPIIPPLCLLLARGVAKLQAQPRWHRTVNTLGAVAIGFAILSTTIYSAQKTFTAYREHRDAFAQFGRAVVKEVDARKWRYAVIGGDDEGLVLYVRRTEFLEPDQGVAAWNDGGLDALVVPEDELAEMLPQLRGREPKQIIRSEPAGRYRRRYVLLGPASLL